MNLVTAVFTLKSTYVVFILATRFLRILIFRKAPLGETFGFCLKQSQLLLSHLYHREEATKLFTGQEKLRPHNLPFSTKAKH